MGEVMLNRTAARALLRDARSQFENDARELHAGAHEQHRPGLEATAEIIGRLSWPVERDWPQEDLGSPFGKVEVGLVPFEFTADTLAWIERERGSVAGHVGDLDRGADGVGEHAYIAEQVYLLHVLNGIVKQLEPEAVT